MPPWLLIDDVVLRARGPDRLVLRRVVEVDGRARRHTGQQDPAGEPGLLAPDHLRHRVVDVVQQDLRDAGAAARRLRAEVDHPAVVRLEPGPAQLVLLRGRRRGDEVGAREERRDRVREQDLGDDAVGVEVADALVAVPVLGALRVVALQVGERVVVRREPAVVVVVVARLEVLLVRLDVGAGVTVGRDDRVAVGRLERVVARVHRRRHVPPGCALALDVIEGACYQSCCIMLPFGDTSNPGDLP